MPDQTVSAAEAARVARAAADFRIEVIAQLRADVMRVTDGLLSLIGPGHHQLAEQVDTDAPLWAADLLDLGPDDYQARRVVDSLMCTLWPRHTEPPTDWWATPLGRAIAGAVGHPTSDIVSYAVAGAMLGCSKQYAHRLAERGFLQRGDNPTGEGGTGVTAASVRDRIRADRERGFHRTDSGRCACSSPHHRADRPA